MGGRPFRLVALTSNKGGVGKTTVAMNLAVLMRALHPELPVLLIGLDDQNLIDRMFALADEPPERDIATALRSGDLGPAIRLGRHAVHYVPTSLVVPELKREITRPNVLSDALLRSGWSGLVLVDTKSDLEVLTQNALWASDLALVLVTDQTSLLEAEKVFRLLESWGRPRARARVLLSLVDLRIKYAGAEHRDVLALLLSEIRRRELPLLESFLSRSPRIEALNTNLAGRPLSTSEQARGSLVHAQLRHLAEDLLRALDESDAAHDASLDRRVEPRFSYPRRLVAFRAKAPKLVELETCDLSRAGLGAASAATLGLGERVHVALAQSDGRPLLLWARVVRASPSSALAFEPPPPEAAVALQALLAAQ